MPTPSPPIIAHISDGGSRTVADLLADNRVSLHDAVNYFDVIQPPLVDQRDRVDDI